jgi:hypothetical protein
VLADPWADAYWSSRKKTPFILKEKMHFLLKTNFGLLSHIKNSQ